MNTHLYMPYPIYIYAGLIIKCFNSLLTCTMVYHED